MTGTVTLAVLLGVGLGLGVLLLVAGLLLVWGATRA